MKVDINTQNRLKTARIKMSKTCPSHKANKTWPMVRLGELGTMVRGNGIRRCETVESGCPCLRYGEIYTSFNVILDKPRSFVPKELFDRSVKIKKGDLVFTLTGENTEEIAKALAYLGEGEIAAGGDLAVWTGHGCDSKYLAYLMYSPQLISQKAATGNGNIVVHTSIKKLQQLEIPLPPHPVQREIVARLERELAAVEKMKKGFETLAETARAEFKAELKEVFEEISRGGAETRRLGEICENLDSRRVPITKSNREAGKYPYYGASGVVDWVSGYIFDGDYLLVSEDGANLIARSTPIAFSVSGRIWVNNHAHILAFSDLTTQRFVEFYFASIKIDDLVTGAAQPKLTQNALNSIEIPLPPLADQREVVSRLDSAKARAEKLEAKARESVVVCETMRKAILKEAFE